MASERPAPDRVVAFVCAHGALRSRLAAALFNEVAPAGWTAISAGLEPEAELGETAGRLLAGTDARRFLDTSPPRALHSCDPAAAIVAIDCELAGAEVWRLENPAPCRAMVDELGRRVRDLAVHPTGKRV